MVDCICFCVLAVWVPVGCVCVCVPVPVESCFRVRVACQFVSVSFFRLIRPLIVKCHIFFSGASVGQFQPQFLSKPQFLCRSRSVVCVILISLLLLSLSASFFPFGCVIHFQICMCHSFLFPCSSFPFGCVIRFLIFMCHSCPPGLSASLSLILGFCVSLVLLPVSFLFCFFYFSLIVSLLFFLSLIVSVCLSVSSSVILCQSFREKMWKSASIYVAVSV